MGTGKPSRDPSDRQRPGPLAGGSLTGRTVVVTRSEENATELRASLEKLGATVLLVPAIRQVGLPGDSPGLALLRRPDRFTHVVFTSQAAVRFFLETLAAQGMPIVAWKRARIAAVGSRTAQALAEAGLAPDRIAVQGSARALALELLEAEGLGPVHGVLLPQSAIARPELEALLTAAGVRVEAVAVYDTVAGESAMAAPFLRAVEAGKIPDAITFYSPSAFRAFLEMTGEPGANALRGAKLRIVSIGPTTSAAIREAGFRVAAQARSPDREAVLEAVAKALGA